MERSGSPGEGALRDDEVSEEMGSFKGVYKGDNKTSITEFYNIGALMIRKGSFKRDL